MKKENFKGIIEELKNMPTVEPPEGFTAEVMSRIDSVSPLNLVFPRENTLCLLLGSVFYFVLGATLALGFTDLPYLGGPFKSLPLLFILVSLILFAGTFGQGSLIWIKCGIITYIFSLTISSLTIYREVHALPFVLFTFVNIAFGILLLFSTDREKTSLWS